MFDAIAGFPTVDYVAHTMINHMNDFGLARYEMGYASAIATLLCLRMIGTKNKIIRRSPPKERETFFLYNFIVIAVNSPPYSKRTG